MAEPTEAALTALLFAMPEVDGVVGELRRALDPSAAWGVPAHITALFPFLAERRLTDAVSERVQDALRDVEPFECTFERTAWFADHVLWLAPAAPDPFICVTRALWTAFPECPPYGGEFADIVPHLTVGDRGSGASAADLRRAEASIAPRLPLSVSVDSVLLMSGRREPASWTARRAFSLAGRPAGGA
jgi:hypothetical protein